MNCSMARDILLTSYQDGSLPPRLQVKLQRHIETCQRCRELEQRLNLLNRQLQTTPAAEPGPDIWENIRKNIIVEQEIGKNNALQKIKESFWFIWEELLAARRPIAAMAVVLVLITGAFIGRQALKTAPANCQDDMQCFDSNIPETGYDLGTGIEEYFL